MLDPRKSIAPKDEFTSCVLGEVWTKDRSLCLALAPKQWDRMVKLLHCTHTHQIQLRVIMRVKWVYQSTLGAKWSDLWEFYKRHVHIHLQTCRISRFHIWLVAKCRKGCNQGLVHLTRQNKWWTRLRDCPRYFLYSRPLVWIAGQVKWQLPRGGSALEDGFHA